MQWQSTGVFLPPYQDNACGDLPPSVHRLKCYLCTHSLKHIVGLQNLQSSSLSSLKMFSKPLYPPCMKIKMLFRLHSCKSFRALQTTVPGHPRACSLMLSRPTQQNRGANVWRRVLLLLKWADTAAHRQYPRLNRPLHR